MITSQQYAYLATDSYTDRPVGVRQPGQREREEIGGVLYVVLEHVSNRRTGYQGTVYQNAQTGEIVVAHRGTEGDKVSSDTPEFLRDLVLADGGMVMARTNLQAGDAIALTERAKDYAEDYGSKPGRVTPQVTVTGHSLGGTLAQITGHKFGLYGETFNAYGAVSLRRYDVPEGGDGMLNHVKVTDFVSAASPHYGQVRPYATVEDIKKLNQYGYLANPLLDHVVLDNPIGMMVTGVQDHLMHNFLPQDVNGRRDVSLLADPTARQRVRDNAAVIDDFRTDMGQLRYGATNSTHGLLIQGVQQGFEHLQERIEKSLRERFTPPPQSMPQISPGQLPPGFPAPTYRPFGALEDGARPQQPGIPSLQGDASIFVDRMLAAARGGDDAAFRQLTQAAANTGPGRELREQALATVDLQEQVQRQAGQELLLAQQQDTPSRAMRMG